MGSVGTICNTQDIVLSRLIFHECDGQENGVVGSLAGPLDRWHVVWVKLVEHA